LSQSWVKRSLTGEILRVFEKVQQRSLWAAMSGCARCGALAFLVLLAGTGGSLPNTDDGDDVAPSVLHLSSDQGIARRLAEGQSSSAEDSVVPVEAPKLLAFRMPPSAFHATQGSPQSVIPLRR